MIYKVLIFLVINFAALGLGSLATNSGVQSDWYNQLSKAPWTPPGWMFGVAWTTIMICFAFYMAKVWESQESKTIIIGLFLIQFILNVAWNPVFFSLQKPMIGLIIISGLTILIGFFLISYFKEIKLWSLFILPYFIWLIIATSLNAYIVMNN